MAATPSTMIELGTQAFDFSLFDTVSDKILSLNEIKGEKGTLIMFICNHCPYVKHINPKLVELANSYQPQGINFIAISSNDVENYPDDSPEKMKITAKELKYSFPYLYDETQKIAQQYDAACTPDFYFFDENLKLVYRGQLDASRPGNNIPVSGEDLQNAFEALLNGKEISEKQIPSIGCGIKWKK